ncbi:hypothetical protein [Paenibacillus xylanexedens]|uniref:hypothetical protein n=1 Tax=Paenibacillus xylanexedens TaxID=528191 RepID=UPI001642BBEC|nr:hypothetical protein [Paenibacillus xylanexedens]
MEGELGGIEGFLVEKMEDVEGVGGEMENEEIIEFEELEGIFGCGLEEVWGSN